MKFSGAGRVFKKAFILFAFAIPAILSYSQSDTIYQVALILPFQTGATSEKLDDILDAHDVFTANRVRFNDDAILSLDFYQGLKIALEDNSDSIRIALSVYDSWSNDSVTTEILKRPELRKMDFIIGSVSSSSAKLVADFCRANKIYNIQPFTPSKSLTTENPYHLKLAPTIDAHIDNMFLSILDSFPDANVIIYSPKNERSFPLAQRFDSLFSNYNATAQVKYRVSLLNATDQTIDDKKTAPEDLIKNDKTNILIITSYDEPFVQGTLRSVFEKTSKANIVVYGLPTWLNGDILRLDYINNLHTRISDAFWADTLKEKTRTFIDNYRTRFFSEPSKYAFLGYDVLHFLYRSVKIYGKDFVSQIITQRYTGIGYKFDIAKNMKNADVINYYENNHVNVMKVEDYRLMKVW